MKIVEDIRPVSYLKARAADLLEQVNQTRRPVVITQNGEPRAVLQDPASYDEMRATIGLLKLVAQGEEDIRAGRVLSPDAVRARIRRRLERRSG